MDPSCMPNIDPCTLIMGLSIAALGAPLALAAAVALAPCALVGGYVGLGLALYGGVLCAPLLPFLLPLALVPLVGLAPLACGCGCHQHIAPFQWRY
jgi:hypothetical protein